MQKYRNIQLHPQYQPSKRQLLSLALGLVIELASSAKTALFKLITPPAKIYTLKQYRELLYEHSSRAAGGLVLSYAQKRAGKLHFRIAKEKAYAHDLILAQIGLHAEISCDLWFLTLEFLQTPPTKLTNLNKNLLSETHSRYVATAPQSHNIDNKFSDSLESRHFNPNLVGIKAYAEKSGDVLFDLLPFTSDLLDENRVIFYGQLRLRYIKFLEQLDKRIDKHALLADLQNYQ